MKYKINYNIKKIKNFKNHPVKLIEKFPFDCVRYILVFRQKGQWVLKSFYFDPNK